MREAAAERDGKVDGKDRQREGVWGHTGESRMKAWGQVEPGWGQRSAGSRSRQEGDKDMEMCKILVAEHSRQAHCDWSVLLY